MKLAKGMLGLMMQACVKGAHVRLYLVRRRAGFR